MVEKIEFRIVYLPNNFWRIDALVRAGRYEEWLIGEETLYEAPAKIKFGGETYICFSYYYSSYEPEDVFKLVSVKHEKSFIVDDSTGEFKRVKLIKVRPKKKH